MVEQKKVVIAGGGLGGICAGIHLLRAGIEDFVILERESEPGGTWRDNTYPGCACDVPVALYQFSFAPSLHWRHVFPRAAEMKHYVDQRRRQPWSGGLSQEQRRERAGDRLAGADLSRDRPLVV